MLAAEEKRQKTSAAQARWSDTDVAYSFSGVVAAAAEDVLAKSAQPSGGGRSSIAAKVVGL